MVTAADHAQEDSLLSSCLDTRAVPSRYGRVTDVCKANGACQVVYIQDLHCNPEVQRNIASLVRSLDQRYGVGRVYVEGAPRGPVDLRLLSSIPDAALKSKTLDILLNAGLLSGAEYFGLTSGTDILYGLEEWKTYTENLERYRTILGDAGTRGRVSSRLASCVETLKKKQYTRSLMRVDRLLSREEGRRRWLDMEKLDKTGALLSAAPNLAGYIRASKLHRTVNQTRAVADLKRFLQEIRTVVSMKEYLVLIEASKEEDTIDDFYRRVADVAARVPDAGRRFPHLTRLLEYLTVTRSINPIALISEEKTFIEQLYAERTDTPVTADVIRLARLSACFRDYVDLRLSADDYAYFSSHRNSFKGLLETYLAPSDAAPVLALLDNAAIEQFYAVNNQRNVTFAATVSAHGPGRPGSLPDREGRAGTDEHPAQVDVVIAGGFHSGVAQLLKRQGVSCVTMTPATTRDYDNRTYAQVMAGRIDYAALLSVASSALAATLTVLGIDDQRNSAIVAAIIAAGMDNPAKTAGIIEQWKSVSNIENLNRLKVVHDSVSGSWRVDIDGKPVFSLLMENGKLTVVHAAGDNAEHRQTVAGPVQDVLRSVAASVEARARQILGSLSASSLFAPDGIAIGQNGMVRSDAAAEDPLATQQVDEVWNAVGNGYMGWRSSIKALLGVGAEDPGSTSVPAFYVAGIFNDLQTAGETSELVNLPNWLGLQILVKEDGRWVDVSQGRVLSVSRNLDTTRSIATMTVLFKSESGKRTEVAVEQFASHDDRHTAGVRYTITPLNYSGDAKLVSTIDGAVTNKGKQHFDVLEHGPRGDNIYYMSVQTRNSGLRVTEAVRLNTGALVTSTDQGQESTVALKRNSGYAVSKILSVYSSDDVKPDAVQTTALQDAEQPRSYDDLSRDHSAASEMNMDLSDVKIKTSDSKTAWLIGQLRLKFYHLWAIGHFLNGTVHTIGAKGLSNVPADGYNGHGFWDTENFLGPFFIWLSPENARQMLMYRYNTIGDARVKAIKMGMTNGELAYDWEATRPGEGEQCPEYGMAGNDRIPILTGTAEHHITADVAYAVWQHYQMTGDWDFLKNFGVEILAGTAKFWVTSADDLGNGKFGYLRRIGPNEYHEHSTKNGKVQDGVDNNIYTNAMAKFNIIKGIQAMKLMEEALAGGELSENDFLKKTGFKTMDAYHTWVSQARHVADNIFINFHPDSKLFEQHETFFSLTDPLEGIDLSDPSSHNAYGRVVNQRFVFERPEMDIYMREHAKDIFAGKKATETQISKQADTLQTLFMLLVSGDLDILFPEQKSAEDINDILRANFEYYEPRTSHGSNLSPGIHAAFSALMGDMPRAMDLLELSAGSMIGSGPAKGIQAASLGALWQAMALGFGGVRISDDGLVIDPHLYTTWRSMSFKIRYRGTLLQIAINGKRVKVQALDTIKSSLKITVAGQGVELTDTARSAVIPLTSRTSASKIINVNRDRLPPGKFKAAIFDLDGVISTTAQLHFAAWKKLFEEDIEEIRGIPFTHDDYLRYVDGKPREEGLKAYLEYRRVANGDGHISIAALGEKKDGYFLAKLNSDGATAYPGTVKLITKLRKHGIQIACASSSKNAKLVLESLGISDLFDVIIAGKTAYRGDSVEVLENLRGKPAPDIFLMAAEMVGAAPQESVSFEDATSGIQAIKAAGMAAVAVYRGEDALADSALNKLEPDVVVKDLGDLSRQDILSLFPTSPLESALEIVGHASLLSGAADLARSVTLEPGAGRQDPADMPSPEGITAVLSAA